MQTRTKIAAFVTAKALLTGCLIAQTSQPPAATEAVVPPESSISQPHDQPHTAPIFWISSVEVMRSTHGPQLDVIRVRGLASTQGWENAELIPLTKGTPPDGVLDLALVAEAPENSTVPSAFPEVEAVLTIEPGHPFRGVRIHGASNRVSLHTLPGYAASGTPPRDCTDCTGKVFVPKGKSAPDKTASGVVREEELPRNLRVLGESDGIGAMSSDPNRMTLLLDEKGQIAAALWD